MRLFVCVCVFCRGLLTTGVYCAPVEFRVNIGVIRKTTAKTYQKTETLLSNSRDEVRNSNMKTIFLTNLVLVAKTVHRVPLIEVHTLSQMQSVVENVTGSSVYCKYSSVD